MLDGIGEQVMKGWHPKTCSEINDSQSHSLHDLTRRMLCLVQLRLMSRCISMSEGTQSWYIVLKLTVLSGMSHAWPITERHSIVSSILYPNVHWHGRIVSFKTSRLKYCPCQYDWLIPRICHPQTPPVLLHVDPNHILQHPHLPTPHQQRSIPPKTPIIPWFDFHSNWSLQWAPCKTHYPVDHKRQALLSPMPNALPTLLDHSTNDMALQQHHLPNLKVGLTGCWVLGMCGNSAKRLVVGILTCRHSVYLRLCPMDCWCKLPLWRVSFWHPYPPPHHHPSLSFIGGCTTSFKSHKYRVSSHFPCCNFCVLCGFNTMSLAHR